MKTVKIKFVGFWNGFNPKSHFIYQILIKHYNVEITEQPDYVICSMFGKPYEYCNYPQVRIMYSGENYIPDFNLIDYAISPYPINFFDRSFHKPACVDVFGRCLALETKNRNYSFDILNKKESFANFIASHESEFGIRGNFFKQLSKYKRVDSPGTYLNNMPSGETVSFTNDTKSEFQRNSKFTLCFESTKHQGFITEKITDAFYADTIPVYYGSDDISDIFNPKAFIDCSRFNSFDEAINKIIELDNDDEKYIEMLRQPIFNDPRYVSKLLSDMENFVLNIFEQPIEQSYRRSRVYIPKTINDYLCSSSSSSNVVAARSKKIKDKISSVLQKFSNKTNRK